MYDPGLRLIVQNCKVSAHLMYFLSLLVHILHFVIIAFAIISDIMYGPGLRSIAENCKYNVFSVHFHL